MSYRSFEEVWQEIAKLEGKDVFTLCQRVKNHILEVNEKWLKRLSAGGKGAPTNVSKAAFKRVWGKLTENGYCKVADGWKIACACIAHLPEVEYSLNPGTIWLSENRHDFCRQVERII